MKDRIFRRDFGYGCEFTQTICDGPVFRWGKQMEISASRNGVMVSGHSLCMKENGIENIKALLDLATSVHRQLAKTNYPDGLWFGNEYIAATNWKIAEATP